jgi:CHAT domain-containing protein
MESHELAPVAPRVLERRTDGLRYRTDRVLSGQRSRLLVVPAVAIGAMVAITLVPPADAQRGAGMGRGQGQSYRQAPQEQAAPGEYLLDFKNAIVAVDRGEGLQAMAYYERVARAAEQQGDQVRAAQAWHCASVVQNRLGRYQKAIQSASRGIELFKDAGALSPQGAWVSAYSQLGAAYRAVGDLDKAREAFEEGLVRARTKMSGRHAGQAEGYLLNNLADIAVAQKAYQQALAYNTQAAHFFVAEETQIGPRAPERGRQNMRQRVAMSYSGIGQAQLTLGRPDEADAAFATGLKYARLSGLREVETHLLSDQASLALKRQDWTKALALYQQSLALFKQTNRTRGSAWLYQGQSRALEGLGRVDEAFASTQEAVRQIEETRADLTDPTLRSGFFDAKQGIYQHAISLALQAQRPEEAFALSERSRSRTFLDLLGSQTVLSKGRTRTLVDEEVKLRTRLAEARAEAEDVQSGEDSQRARAQVEALDRDYKAFLERVRKENLEQASLMSVEPVTLSEIQSLLPEGTTLLEYHIGEGGITVWVVDRQHFTTVKLPGDSQSLPTQVRELRGSITNRAPTSTVQAQALYERLLEPARSEIRGDRLLIVPHGILHYLPFASLRSPAGRWVVEEFAVSTLPSASVLRYLTDKGTGTATRALVVGNPDLGADLALPWAEREARLVGQREPNATVLVGADATEAQVKKLADSVGLIHLATHGELNESDPLSSAVLLVPGGGEDGRLEVREVFGLDLHAKLVVLSACETGLGKLARGDEVVGLQRAFLYAGTPAVITTLWKVDDKATYDLIRAFYSKLESAGPVEALRQAQLETMATYPHPYQWAAFNLTGAPR